MNKILRILKKIVLYVFSTAIFLSIVTYVYLYIVPKGPEITKNIKIKEGEDSFVMYAYKQRKRKSIKVFTYKPEGWRSGNKLVFVMHGGGRNAEDYRDAWITLARKK